MASITISLYTIRVGQKRSRKNLVLDSFAEKKGGGTKDLLTELSQILSTAKREANDEASKTFSIKEAKKTGRVIDGRVNVGTYGYGASLQDVKTGAEKYRRVTTDAEVLPLYYRIYVPKGKTTAVLAVQSFGDVGAKTLLANLLVEAFLVRNNGYSLRIRKLELKAVIDKALKQGQISKLRLIHHGIPADLANTIGNRKGGSAEIADVELVVKAKSNNSLGSFVRAGLRKAYAAPASATDVFEVENFEYHEIRAEVDVGGRPRVIKIGRSDAMSSRIDVTDEVELNYEGHPKQKSLSDECERLIALYSTNLD